MTPEMKRELLLALDAMLDNREFEGEHFIAQPDTEDTWPRCALQPPAEEQDGFDYDETAIVFLAPALKDDDKLHLCVASIDGNYERIFAAQLAVFELLGIPHPGGDKSFAVGGTLTIHALRIAVKEELAKLQVA